MLDYRNKRRRQLLEEDDDVSTIIGNAVDAFAGGFLDMFSSTNPDGSPVHSPHAGGGGAQGQGRLPRRMTSPDARAARGNVMKGGGLLGSMSGMGMGGSGGARGYTTQGGSGTYGASSSALDGAEGGGDDGTKELVHNLPELLHCPLSPADTVCNVSGAHEHAEAAEAAANYDDWYGASRGHMLVTHTDKTKAYQSYGEKYSVLPYI